MRSVATALKLPLIDIRLSLYDPTDLRGFPVVRGTGAKERMHFVPPAMLPRTGKGIILLDELPAAPPSVQAVAYQLILDRRLGEYTVPAGWSIVAAGNYARNGGVHYALAPALANRFIHIDMVCTQPDWDAWAADNDVTFITRAFMRFRPALLHNIDARKTGMAFPSPRSWKFTDDLVKQKFGSAEQYELIKGTVGEGAATEYLAFIKTADGLPTAKEILADPMNAKLPTSPAAKYAVSAMLEKYLEAKTFSACLEYLSRLEVEYQTVFMYNVSRSHVELCGTKEFITWTMKNKAVLGMA